MALSAVTPHFTRCAPGDSSGRHRDTVFSAGILPVSVRFAADGDVESTSISFEDYGKMHSITRRKHGERRIDTPSWAVDDKKLRKLLVRFLEGNLRPQYEQTDSARIARAAKHRRDNEPKLQTTLDNLCREYTALKDAKVNLPRQRQLTNLIQGIDTQLRLSNTAGLVAAIVYFYYRVGYDSVGCSEAIGGINPVLVRHVLWRLRRVWARMEREQSAPVRKIPRQNKCRKCGLEAPRARQHCFVCFPFRKRK